MAVYFYFFEYRLLFIISTILWITLSCFLVVGSRFLKKDPNELRFLEGLNIAGYILIVWFIVNFFLPTGIGISSSTILEELLWLLIPIMLYDVLPNLIFITLGILLLTFFKKNKHLFKNLLVNVSVLFIGGYGLRLINFVILRFTAYFDFNLYLDYRELFVAMDIISLIARLSAVLIFLLFFLYINNSYIIVFSCLFFVQLFSNLIVILPNI
ncbi:MAG: hypothetical protein ACFFA3_14550 [Promethearchaeota archaeon]